MTVEKLDSALFSWITDIHLDSADEEAYQSLVSAVKVQEPHAVLVGGDIANAAMVTSSLRRLRKDIGVPLYFVLGNHDFWGGSIKEQRERMNSLMKEDPTISYLNESGPVALTPSTALVGHDGWSDAKEGDFFLMPLALKDYLFIQELCDLTPEKRCRVLNGLGEEAAYHIGKQLDEALEKFEKVIVLTHVPPFREASLYQGMPAGDRWAPHFVCQSVGKCLMERAEQWPDKEILVLCGHSHHEADFSPLPNLRVLVGQAEYRYPAPQDPIILSLSEEK